jgi:hypothetical protein
MNFEFLKFLINSRKNFEFSIFSFLKTNNFEKNLKLQVFVF